MFTNLYWALAAALVEIAIAAMTNMVRAFIVSFVIVLSSLNLVLGCAGLHSRSLASSLPLLRFTRNAQTTGLF
jgi:hypothetical protein